MRSAVRILMIAAAAATLAACHKAESNEAALSNSDLSVDGNLTSGQIPSNAEIETLPPDESSVTSSGELNSGDDNPDVNDLGNAH
jgi:ABC-type uncharacterized transport system auxiliary subunit